MVTDLGWGDFSLGSIFFMHRWQRQPSRSASSSTDRPGASFLSVLRWVFFARWRARWRRSLQSEHCTRLFGPAVTAGLAQIMHATVRGARALMCPAAPARMTANRQRSEQVFR